MGKIVAALAHEITDHQYAILMALRDRVAQQTRSREATVGMNATEIADGVYFSPQHTKDLLDDLCSRGIIFCQKIKGGEDSFYPLPNLMLIISDI